MSEMTATRIGRGHSGLLTAGLLGLVAWIVTAVLLWRTTVPADLRLPHLDPRDYFTAAELARTARYERFLRVDWALSVLAEIVALAVLAARAPRWAGNLRLGRIGSGVVIGTLTLTTLWFVALPFDLAARWWRERHGLTRGSYVDWLVDPWLTLVGEAVLALVVIVVVMALAGRFPRGWWIVVAPIVLVLALSAATGYGALASLDTHAISSAELRRDARSLTRRLDAEGTVIEVQKVRNLTTQANAQAVGLGPTERVVLWDTLLDGRFTNGEVRVVLAHELGHIVRGHLWKGMAWFALFVVPGLFLLAEITRRRGGLREPGVLPFAVLVVVVLNLVATPLANVVSRRYEAEADWVALRATRDPAAARGLFERFSATSLSQPNPPTWSYVIFRTHPTIMQRIAMAKAFAERERLALSRQRKR